MAKPTIPAGIIEALNAIPVYDENTPVLNWEDKWNGFTDAVTGAFEELIGYLEGDLMAFYLDAFLPVGRVLATGDPTYNPGGEYEGTVWERLPSEHYLATASTVAANGFYVTKRPGNNSDTITTAMLPRHRHALSPGTVSTKTLKGSAMHGFAKHNASTTQYSGIVQSPGLGDPSNASVNTPLHGDSPFSSGFKIDASHYHSLGGNSGYSGNATQTPHDNRPKTLPLYFWKRIS